ncbi:MAG: protein-glutamate O-methyltransferase CheR [Archangiaceae bacterium]|nr:protein-glutamate O-methyltransferase CheR [Archangiaceae bacterium]
MSEPTPEDVELNVLLDAIYQRYHYDFRKYSEASLRRRVATALLHFRVASISRLQEKVLHEPRAFTELLGFLTVQVSDMFRDPTYFKSLREQVLPYLRTYPTFKVWVAGCSTGEEAWSMAILLAEEGLLDRSLIYATDINPEALRTAEEGVYALERFALFSANYQASGGKRSLSSWYHASSRAGLLDRSLKKHILFSDHSLATDSVFAEVELASCRNVLIYFDKDLQNRAVGLLRDSLRRKGFLGLGSKESLRFTAHSATFADFVPQDRIYQRL